jgi:hypothetical protein
MLTAILRVRIRLKLKIMCISILAPTVMEPRAVRTGLYEVYEPPFGTLKMRMGATHFLKRLRCTSFNNCAH